MIFSSIFRLDVNIAAPPSLPTSSITFANVQLTPRESTGLGEAERGQAALEPRRDLSEAVVVRIRYYEVNAGRRCYGLYRKRGLPVESGVVESICKLIVGNRLKKAGCRWSKAGANALLAIRCCLENMRWPDFLDWRTCRAAVA